MPFDEMNSLKLLKVIAAIVTFVFVSSVGWQLFQKYIGPLISPKSTFVNDGYDWYNDISTTTLGNSVNSGSDVSVAQSLIGNDPTQVQDSFLVGLIEKHNDPATQQAAYFIMHRYFDTGYSLSELYDYIQSHPVLSFMMEAKKIDPEGFAKLASGTPLSDHENDMAFLALLEVLKNHGYADGATLTTGASMYMELYAQASTTDLASKKLFKSKADSFFTAAVPQIELIVANATSTANAKDSNLVALNHFGEALAFYEKYNLSPHTKLTSLQVFQFANSYAVKNKLLLRPFTALITCYAYILTGREDLIASVGLGSIFMQRYAHIPEFDKYSLVDKVLHEHQRGFWSDGVYGYNTIQKIAQYDADFANFLAMNNWPQ